MNDEPRYQKNDRVWIECSTEDGCLRKRPAIVIAYLKQLYKFYANENFVAIRYEDVKEDENPENCFECVLESRVSHRKEKE